MNPTPPPTGPPVPHRMYRPDRPLLGLHTAEAVYYSEYGYASTIQGTEGLMYGMTGGGWRAASPGAWLGRLLGGPGFTAAEVRNLLAASHDSARARAVRQCLARPGDWLNPPPDAFTLPWRYQRHIPRIAFWYARGESIAAIEAQLSGDISTWAVERSIAVACSRIAVCLNRDPATYGLAR